MEAKILIGCDHAGFELKAELIQFLKEQNIEVIDKGCYSDESVDYPDFAHQVALGINKEAPRGVLICGSANGISISANKHKHVRCAIAWKKEIAELARQHNDANVVSLPARFISSKEAIDILKAFLHTEFEGGRHQKRVDKISF
jgi:ribose 5-phosphate isomerase B